ncbi:membrane protein, putative [Marinilactibacillus psychrotolerans 42ea]|uniref:Membrane protein, putative n=1 Tax=Marinilactibacillus psychrotolerans 42ea TaxID=1255609 RepID=A0A1R4J4C8_9LACT|nr:acyltransferase family protein [Marinilactibacillus psychrotolerans]SJN26892.1 membrane protein, putative [Marinilactibacillus psychrotolerans 42ea]
MKQRVWYADVLRIIAIVMVILIHIVSKDTNRYELETMDWQWLNFINGISRICVPILFMVSGMFFLDPRKKLEPKTMYTKYIWRLIRAFFVWSAIYVLFDQYKQPDVAIAEEVDRTIIQIVQGYFHLWFLYRLTEIYVMVPLLRPLTKEKQLAIYFVLVSFVVGFLIPTINQFPVRSTDTVADNGLNVDITLGYAGYFMAGYLLSRYTLPKNWRRTLYGLGIIGFAVTVVGTALRSAQDGTIYSLFYEYLTPNVFFASLATFVFVKHSMEQVTLSEKMQKIIIHISKYSFGVYLVHVLIRDLIWDLGLNTTLFTPIISIPLLALLVGGISYVIIWGLMKIWEWIMNLGNEKNQKAT